ncbi:hypothetical protein COD81_28990 [Bacillus cereus]|uniref:hypothetical protein n=1 Tax=Bacillus cereus TaxID=1396 RepID=UPI000BF7848A|nr:hypothetical protein [Bacillus cereus]PFL73141.1 hypothetical protein COJ32_28780 [Bacillus cereus]PGV02015.1 hypothetical protein COD81_28990 [Bacillus cereus]
MFFSINAYKFLIGMDDTFRLKEDGSWKKQNDFTAFDPETDMLFESYQNAQFWLTKNDNQTINGEVVSTKKKESYSLMDREFEFEIICHRTSKPAIPYPSKGEVKQVLLSGDDNYNNSLVINYDGYVQLIKVQGFVPAAMRGYAVRFETFIAGNGYVGKQDELNHLNGTYLALLEGWLSHLKGGKEVYRDYISGENTINELIALIDAELKEIK